MGYSLNASSAAGRFGKGVQVFRHELYHVGGGFESVGLPWRLIVRLGFSVGGGHFLVVDFDLEPVLHSLDAED
jgi:hypothetical protein